MAVLNKQSLPLASSEKSAKFTTSKWGTTGTYKRTPETVTENTNERCIFSGTCWDLIAETAPVGIGALSLVKKGPGKIRRKKSWKHL